MQLKVIKADSTEEQYLHTKVIATFINAFGAPDEKNTYASEQFSDAVTFYLYNKYGKNNITSAEILSIIKAVLDSAGFYKAVDNLAGHYQRRNLLRARVHVIKLDSEESTALMLPGKIDEACSKSPWNKSKISSDLINEYNIDAAMARTIAATVEEKVLGSGFRLIPTAFVKFLVLQQAQAILSAQQQIKTSRTVTEVVPAYNNTVMDDRLRQPQNGLCPVEA